MRQSNTRTPAVFHVGLVLLCLVLFSTYLTGGLYARYTTSASGSDSARVARFEITGGGNWTDSTENIDLDLNFFDPNKTSASLDFTISSASEVAVEYDVVITMPTLSNNSDYQEWLKIELKKGEDILETLTADDESTVVFTFDNVGEFAPNQSGAHAYTLVFSITDEFLGIPPAGLMDLKDGTVEITIRAEQID